MQLGIYSLEKVLFHGDALSVNCNTKNGEITVLDHHEPLISILAKGVIKIVDTNHQEHYVQAHSGFLEINSRNEAKVLIEEGD
jgi:F-type H+-transporting ATPase subunit epsilon